jgi:hypothetical protein
MTFNHFAWELSPFVGLGFEGFASGSQVTTPGFGFVIRQFDFGQDIGQIAARANLFIARRQLGRRASHS